MSSFDVSCFPQCDGSCRYIEEGTFVLASVTGPLHSSEKSASQDPLQGVVEVRCQLADRSASDRVLVERRIEEYVSQTLSVAVDLAKFPRQVVTVAVSVVFDDGRSNARRVAMNACVLALLDALVPLKALPLTVDCGDETIVTLDAATKDVLAFESNDVLFLEDLDDCFATANTKATALLDFFRSAADSHHGGTVAISDDWRQGPVGPEAGFAPPAALP